MRQRNLATSMIAATSVVLAAATTLFAADNLLIADFEQKTYGEWKVEGDAFGSAPAKGTIGTQQRVSGFEGKGLVNTFIDGDKPTGKLTSPPFKIERNNITFLIGGGHHPGKTCMNLLIDKKVVHSATGPNINDGGNEFLNWENWDVKKYKGKMAVIQIVDNHAGGWGHINVDQIAQSDKPMKKKSYPQRKRKAGPPPMANAREIEITGKYIIFPVANEGAKRGRMRITVDDQLVHHLDCDFPANKDAISWWTYLDMEEYKGKTAKVSAGAAEEIVAMIESSDEIRDLMPLYDEALRPQFHISQKRGWNNDPNGMMYYDGKYYFFWQCNPAGRGWANMYWGYATSPDMIHWTEHDRALRSFGDNVVNRHPKMVVKNAFSGSGNVDHKNTAGWQTGKEKTLVLAFTDTGCGEALAYSTDAGKTWKYYEDNPVIRHGGRDPKLIWYDYDKKDTPISETAKKLGGHWVIAVYDKKGGNNVAIYTSTNLKEWTEQSHLHGYFECAELFELPVDGDEKNTRWVVFAADAKYAIGDFDGKTFTPEHKGKHQVHWGSYYASQCFSSSPDDRVVQVGWARIGIQNMPFNQTFTVPTTLTLSATPDGIRMLVNPIKELEKLRKRKPKSTRKRKLTPEEPAISFEAKDQHYDIVVTLKKGTAGKAVLQCGADTVTYDFNNQKLDEMPLRLKDDEVTFRVLIDRPIREIIGGGGACFKTTGRRAPGQPLGTISLQAEGGSLTIESLEIHEMKSAWKKQ